MAKRDLSKQKTQRMQMSILFQVEYDAPVSSYPQETPDVMAELDSRAVEQDAYRAIQAFANFPGAKFQGIVIPVLTEAQKAELGSE